MLITRIELENIKSYRNISVDFRRGTTAINGPNGAGKTTLVEAIGYALFDHLSYNQSQFVREGRFTDRKSTRLNSSHSQISYAVFCLKKKKRDSIAIMERPRHSLPVSD